MTIEQQALALVNEVEVRNGNALCRTIGTAGRFDVQDALTLALERHEAFRQEVSEGLRAYFGCAVDNVAKGHLGRFIIATPVDPLVEAIKDAGYATLDAIEAEFAHDLRAALAKHGLAIRSEA